MYKNFIECLSERMEKMGDVTALEFLAKGEGESLTLSYAELYDQASILAMQLKEMQFVGKTALLLYPSSIDYLVGFFGCLFAGVVAVPAYPPKNNHHARRLDNIIQDAGVAVAMTHSSISQKVRKYLSIEVCCEMDTSPSHGAWQNNDIESDDVAYLQYTSGSTGSPKGVIVTHKNIMENCRLYARGVGVGKGGHHISWLPLFHDMGLVQGILLPLWQEATAVFMPPEKFIQKPGRWVKALSRYRGVMTGGPNFAYDLCANRISESELEHLDLSKWKVAVNGAEPVHKSTLDNFIQRFKPAKFSPATFFPGYGMAETTLYVTAGDVTASEPYVEWLDEPLLKNNQLEFVCKTNPGAKPIVACGKLISETLVKIVDPILHKECEKNKVGEIWVSGDIVCGGYWNKPVATKETFLQNLEGYSNRTFLRTGDLGFIYNNQLFITGRIKDVIIVRGENHYPQDIEATVESVSNVFRKGGFCAAFTVVRDESEALIAVQEVERTKRKSINVENLRSAVLEAVFVRHGLTLADFLLVFPGEILKTSSGKIQRSACKQKYLNRAYICIEDISNYAEYETIT